MVVKNRYIKPSLPPNEQVKLEKGFTLDCVAVGTLASDGISCSPKLASGIPPYNSQHDKMLKRYFKSPVVQKTLKRTGQDGGGESMNGKQADHYTENGSMGRYIESRNRTGAGNSANEIAGHNSNLSNSKSCIGYNGKNGYRRNTPQLRHKPSLFQEK